MLTPNYLYKITEACENIASQLEVHIISLIVERMLARFGRGEDDIITATDVWNAKVLQDAGILLEDVAKKIAKYVPVQEQEIYNVFEEAMETSYQYDSAIYQAAGIATDTPLKESPEFIRIIERNFEKTKGEMVNFTGTLATRTQDIFIQEVSNAYLYAMSGAESYTRAFRKAVDHTISQGLRVYYPSGHSDTVETATLRAVRTGISQTAAEVTLKRMDEMDWDLVLVSQHAGARPSHFEWQGKMYSRYGRTKGYPDFITSTGYGTVTGLCGANCRHSFGPANEGYNPYEQLDKKKSDELYEKQQTQRSMERAIRKTKGQLQEYRKALDSCEDGTKLKEGFQKKYDRLAAKLSDQNKEYIEFCDKSGLRTEQSRLYKAGWNRSQASKASAAARRYKANHG